MNILYELNLSIYEIYNDSNRGGGTLKDLYLILSCQLKK